MPRLHNPTEYRLAYDTSGALLGPGETVEISEELADRLKDGCVFIVERGRSAKPERKAVKRGSKRVEVSIAPQTETRGLTTGNVLPR